MAQDSDSISTDDRDVAISSRGSNRMRVGREEKTKILDPFWGGSEDSVGGQRKRGESEDGVGSGPQRSSGM